MTDENKTQADEGHEKELKKVIREVIKETGSTQGLPGDLASQIPDTPGDGAVKMMEMNPYLILDIDGSIEVHRQMTNQRIDVSPSGKSVIMHLLPITMGPIGFQGPEKRAVTLHLSLDQLKEKINGDVWVDLREFCKASVPAWTTRIGAPREEDGALFAGFSPDKQKEMYAAQWDERSWRSFHKGKRLAKKNKVLTGYSAGKPQYIEPYHETLRMNFYRAKFRAWKLSRKTGKHWRVPSDRELSVLFNHISRFPGFNKSALYRDGAYWSSSSKNIFTGNFGFSANPKRGSYGHKLRKMHVHLVCD